MVYILTLCVSRGAERGGASRYPLNKIFRAQFISDLLSLNSEDYWMNLLPVSYLVPSLSMKYLQSSKIEVGTRLQSWYFAEYQILFTTFLELRLVAKMNEYFIKL